MSYKIIIQKSIDELKTKKSSYEKEISALDKAICTLEDLISKEKIIDNIKKEILKTRRNNYSNKGKITESSVRDAIMELAINPPAELAGNNKLDNGYFLMSQVASVMKVTPQHKINLILFKFYQKKMLDRKQFLSGYQYRYINPLESSFKKDIETSNKEILVAKVAQSNPIPGTGKNSTVIRNKDVERMVAQAKTEGFQVERLGSDHIRVSNNGTEKIATISATGRDKARYVENCRADLKRIGVNV